MYGGGFSAIVLYSRVNCVGVSRMSLMEVDISVHLTLFCAALLAAMVAEDCRRNAVVSGSTVGGERRNGEHDQ